MKAKKHSPKPLEEIKDIKDFEKEVLKNKDNFVIEHELTYQQFQMGVERWYFWLLDYLKESLKYDPVKTEDEFLSAEMSSFWGVQAQRVSMQQEKAQQLLATIAGMIKSLFQIIRSLRIMDERLDYYTLSEKGDKAAEIALKGIWVDLVEGGAKNPSSIYGMAAQVGFITLPDLFFDIKPKSSKDVDRVVEAIDVNNKVKEVLKRKLFQFMEWRESTHKELITSKRFHLRYLKQHVNAIKLYIRWVQPYLKTIKTLEQRPAMNVKDVDIISALETTTIDLELFATRWEEFEKEVRLRGKTIQKGTPRKYHRCIRVHFHYRTVPEMAFQQEYQRGAIHVGRSVITFEAFVLSTKQIEKYIELKDKQDIEIIKDLDASMNALGDDLEKYLAEANVEDAIEKKESKAVVSFLGDILKKPMEPFLNIGKGFAMLGSALIPKFSTTRKGTKGAKKAEKDLWIDRREKHVVLMPKAKKDVWNLYETFKKAYQMVTW